MKMSDLMMGVAATATVALMFASLEGGGSTTNSMEVGEVPTRSAVGSMATRTLEPQEWTQDTVVLVRSIGGDDDFGKTIAIEVVGDVLFVGDSQIAPHLAAVDLQTGTVVARVGSHGEGPREFQAPGGISPVRDATRPSVWVHDFYNRRISRVKLTAAKTLEVVGSIPLQVATTTEYPEVLDDRIVSAGLFGDEAVLMFFDLDGGP